MTEPSPLFRRSPGPRPSLLAMATVGITMVLLALVWRHASAYRPTGAHEATEAASAALKAAGLPWAAVRMADTTAVVVGRAPDDLARVQAYQIARRALRPFMEDDAPVRALRSAVSLRIDAKPRTLHRGAVTPALDVAALLPPPMPLGHASALATIAPATTPVKDPHARPADETGAASVSALEPSETPASVATTAEMRPDQSAPAHKAYAPTAATVASQPDVPAPGSEADSHDRSASAMATVPIETVSKKPQLETAALQSSAPAPQTASACTQAFEAALANGTVNFAVGSAAIVKESRPLLDNLAAIAKRCRAHRLTVEGHTDLTGGRAHNLELSRRRAEAVRAALIDRGIDMDHITATGFGATRPLMQGTTEAANARNRRIAITVSGGG